MLICSYWIKIISAYALGYIFKLHKPINICLIYILYNLNHEIYDMLHFAYCGILYHIIWMLVVWFFIIFKLLHYYIKKWIFKIYYYYRFKLVKFNIFIISGYLWSYNIFEFNNWWMGSDQAELVLVIIYITNFFFNHRINIYMDEYKKIIYNLVICLIFIMHNKFIFFESLIHTNTYYYLFTKIHHNIFAILLSYYWYPKFKPLKYIIYQFKWQNKFIYFYILIWVLVIWLLQFFIQWINMYDWLLYFAISIYQNIQYNFILYGYLLLILLNIKLCLQFYVLLNIFIIISINTIFIHYQRVIFWVYYI